MNQTQAERDAAPCVIAKCKTCSGLVYASVDGHWDAKAKKELADLVIAGYEVSKLPAAEVRKQKWGCQCTQ